MNFSKIKSDIENTWAGLASSGFPSARSFSSEGNFLACRSHFGVSRSPARYPARCLTHGPASPRMVARVAPHHPHASRPHFRATASQPAYASRPHSRAMLPRLPAASVRAARAPRPHASAPSRCFSPSIARITPAPACCLVLRLGLLPHAAACVACMCDGLHGLVLAWILHGLILARICMD